MCVGSKRLVVGMTGASGAIYGVRLMQILHRMDHVETHLVISDAARLTLQHEMGLSVADVQLLADKIYDVNEMTGRIASGSFQCAGMVVAPCSMKTLSAVASGFCDNLLTRAADVILKERRRLVLMVRETPFNLAHLRNMQSVTEMGGIIYPPVPAFYCRPLTIEEMVDQTVRRVLELFDIVDDRIVRWEGTT
ncbi:UbiX family flavin prenyltransferase [Oxalobacter paraformigenes]|uniref:Flavin prenyltransferase UbiX n=1 Tax=Oxalobacter paraformigenes TaxID=556268 RepID=C3X636_9BURK|nr:UbiX family flavin prenyltransferase [Oxalobacter paraformigenes]EEO28672.2 polyprenyl P-hydroxybenzoate and phenylacrylic acid decarboxylase [Oxalobacter paraformigenes]